MHHVRLLHPPSARLLFLSFRLAAAMMHDDASTSPRLVECPLDKMVNCGDQFVMELAIGRRFVRRLLLHNGSGGSR